MTDYEHNTWERLVCIAVFGNLPYRYHNVPLPIVANDGRCRHNRRHLENATDAAQEPTRLRVYDIGTNGTLWSSCMTSSPKV